MVTSQKKSPIKPESLSLEKRAVRRSLKRGRAALLPGRRAAASRSLLRSFSTLLLPFPRILSFAAHDTEINTTPLNHLLAQRGQLYLPKMAGNDLHIHRITDLDYQLAPNSLRIPEPVVEHCQRIAPDRLSLILVPALGFDNRCHRIGCGKGFYDRLLQSLPHCPSYGIGFTEQSVDRLPISDQDIALSKLFLF